jgi:cysteine sulfinate desulfinase/cysteine desulfurase-like protein
MDRTAMADDAASNPDLLVARAMDRVLESEQSAQAAIHDCERECTEILERAREQRRAILESAHARIVALHTRAAKALELRIAKVIEQRKQAAAAAAVQLSDPERRSAALERMAARLTADDSTTVV